MTPSQRNRCVAQYREKLLANQSEAQQLRKSLIALTSVDASSRTGYLRMLHEEIGPPPERTWESEWDAMNKERCKLAGRTDISYPKLEGMIKMAQANVTEMLSLTNRGEAHWTREEAEMYWCLQALGSPMSKAISDKSARYAASTYAFSDLIYSHLRRMKFYSGEGAPPLPRPMYCNLRGLYSLVAKDPNWARIEEPDVNGFRGLTTTAPLNVGCNEAMFDPEGKGVRSAKRDNEGNLEWLVQDSDIVMFESAPTDEHGVHAPLTLSHGAEHGVFPPNVLFRLKRVETGGFYPFGPDKLKVHQRLLVMSATFREPREGQNTNQNNKLCGSSATLRYGDRQQYIVGLGDIISASVLKIEQEFARDMSWTDWKGARYTLRDEFAYVTGAAKRLAGRTPGTRDTNNDGRTVDQFQELANAHIRSRRAAGHGLVLPEQYALLRRAEVLAIRLYSGAAFQPINSFLRQISALTGEMRLQMAQNVSLTFAATVGHLCSAIRKLSAVATPEEARTPLFRGVRGKLSPEFWGTDDQGMVVATDTAFMSTSRNRRTPVAYMAEGEHNVLWELQPSTASDIAFHSGADISMLSQYAGEDEVLFPPCTMLVCQESSIQKRGEECQVDGKAFTAIRVEPHFI